MCPYPGFLKKKQSLLQQKECQMFNLISGRHVDAQSVGPQHGVYTLSSIHLRGTFRRVTQENWKCCLFNTQTTSPSFLRANSQRGAETLNDCSPNTTILWFLKQKSRKITRPRATHARLFSIGEQKTVRKPIRLAY